MTNLVEAHAAAVKPALATVALPTAAVAEQAKAQAEDREGRGRRRRRREGGAARRRDGAGRAGAARAGAPELIDDEYLEIAHSLERGMWIEFESEDGQLAFAKLAWISPLRGTYLFTNRQGQKALSMTAEELADALPLRPRAPGRGRAADRPRVRLDDAADRHPVPAGSDRRLTGPTFRARDGAHRNRTTWRLARSAR